MSSGGAGPWGSPGTGDAMPKTKSQTWPVAPLTNTLAHLKSLGDHPGTVASELAAVQDARAILVERLEHVVGKVDHGGLLCHRQAASGILVRVCHVASRTIRCVGMPARVNTRVNTYVEDAFAVV